MKLPKLKIGHLTLNQPVVLGGMGVGITRHRLASAVTLSGGLGVISGVNLGFTQADFIHNTLEANLRALREEIRKAKKLTSGGPIGVNFMVAMNHYTEHVKVAVSEGVDFIVSGAGLPKNLPELVDNTKTLIAPIVSSTKAAKLITKFWDRTYQRVPDAVILEGIHAGGHLGFSLEDIENETFDAESSIKNIREMLRPYEDQYNQAIPIILAGGIRSYDDVKKALQYGAEGVQVATRFIATKECDASDAFKKHFILAKAEDVHIIKSPVGLPGRAIKSVKKDHLPKRHPCLKCLQTCNPSETPYCISSALIHAVEGNISKGLVFSGQYGYEIQEITSVEEVMKSLCQP